MKKTFVEKHENQLIFLVVCLCVVAGILMAALHWFPRKPTLADLIMAMTQQQAAEEEQQEEDKRPPWEKWMDMGRSEPPPPMRPPAQQQVEGAEGATGDPKGPRLSQEQLALRQKMLAELILTLRNAKTPDQAFKSIRDAKIEGPFRDYEEKRFLEELLWLEYYEGENKQAAIERLHKLTVPLTKRPSSNFEDDMYAGIACLGAGDPDTAITYLRKALDEWPARDRARGLIYLHLMVAYAVKGNRRETMTMLSSFVDNFPDWLFVETYVPELEEFVRVYPQAALLTVIRGRVMQLVYDYSRATELYSQALESGKLDSFAVRQVGVWHVETKGAKF
jgi:tetratricopeptide (TPR) repeat protein